MFLLCLGWWVQQVATVFNYVGAGYAPLEHFCVEIVSVAQVLEAIGPCPMAAGSSQATHPGVVEQ